MERNCMKVMSLVCGSLESLSPKAATAGYNDEEDAGGSGVQAPLPEAEAAEVEMAATLVAMHTPVQWTAVRVRV